MALSIVRFSNIKNPYDVLGVLPTVMLTEIKEAYRTKAKKTHPDRNPPNEKARWEKSFKEVHEAYEILSNPQTRKDYDEYLDARKAPEKHVANFKKEWSLGTKKKRVWIYVILAEIVLTVGFSLGSCYIFGC
jgi:curved DNA-binding protein CbpA